MTKGKILIIEDDPSTAVLIGDTLKRENYNIRTVDTLEKARGELSSNVPDMIILDRKLPDGDGIDFCREIRSEAKTNSIPILFLTAFGSKYDKVTGLRVGGDDYLTKPFDFEELVARVEAFFRRMKKEIKPVADVLKTNGVVLDVTRHECRVEGKLIDLWPKEFELLKAFLANKDRVLSKEFLAEYAWNQEYLKSSRTMDITIQRLRKKLGKRKGIIETVKGYGFKLKEKG
jgi:DNA-binding response OmpR family regulator